MDERQQQIRAGAGLEESRLNTEFIDFIQKWGGPFLIICALLMGAWAGWNWLERKKSQRLDEAFGQYEAQLAGGNPSPEALRAVAEEFSGIASVSLLARLNAADIYLAAIRSGVRTGATPTPRTVVACALTPRTARLMAQAAASPGRPRCLHRRQRKALRHRRLHGLAVLPVPRRDRRPAHHDRIVQVAEQTLTHHARQGHRQARTLPTQSFCRRQPNSPFAQPPTLPSHAQRCHRGDFSSPSRCSTPSASMAPAPPGRSPGPA